MEMHSPFPALRDFHLKVKRLTMICASLALLHPLLSLTHWIFGSLMLPYKSSSRSAKYVRWCDSCSLATPMQRAELNTARQSSHKSPARDDGAGGPPIVISTEAKRSGEISPSDGTGGITVGDLSTQSIMGAVPVCLPYRHVPPLEMTMLAAPLPSFRPKRSGVEKSPFSDGTGSITREISRLRVSWERFPSAPYRHASPLEMTMLASTPLVISTVEAEWRNLLPPMVRSALRQEISRL